MTAASTLPLRPNARPAGICWDHRLVPLRWSGSLKKRQPMHLLPRWRLAPTVQPIISGATRTAESGDDLRGSEAGKGLLEAHGSKHSPKRKIGNAENSSCNSRQCRHNPPMHTNSTGRFTMTPDASDIKIACSKSRLARILAAEIDAAGNWRVTPEDQAWAIRVSMSRPEWAESTLLAAGIASQGNNALSKPHEI